MEQEEKVLDSEYVEQFISNISGRKLSDDEIYELLATLALTRVIMEFKPNFNNEINIKIKPLCVKNEEGEEFIAVFTSNKQRFFKEDVEQPSTLNIFFTDLCNESLLKTETLKGIVINPFTEPLLVNKNMIELITIYKEYIEKKNKN